MKEYRCKKCRKLLFRYEDNVRSKDIEGAGCVVEIKCDRTNCGEINVVRIPQAVIEPRIPVEITA